MRQSSRPQRRKEHIFLGVLALAMIALHVFWFWELYGGFAINGISAESMGVGALFRANLLILVATFGALLMLVTAAVRSFRARAEAAYTPTLLLLGIGAVLPWAGIALSFWVAGDAI